VNFNNGRGLSLKNKRAKTGNKTIGLGGVNFPRRGRRRDKKIIGYRKTKTFLITSLYRLCD